MGSKVRKTKQIPKKIFLNPRIMTAEQMTTAIKKLIADSKK